MRFSKKLTRCCAALAVASVGLSWNSSAFAITGHHNWQWVRATTDPSESIAMDYVGQRTIAVGGWGATSNQTDALWVLSSTLYNPNNKYDHPIAVWNPSTQSWTFEGAAAVLGGGSPYDYPYAITQDGTVWGYNGGGGWFQYLPAGTANPLGFIQETRYYGDLFFSQAGLGCDYWYGSFATPCIDEYNAYGQSWVGQNIASGEGTGSTDLYATSNPDGTQNAGYLANGPYRLAVDPSFADGQQQVKIGWANNFGNHQDGQLGFSTDSGRTWTDCFGDPDPVNDNLPVLVDLAGYAGSYYGIEIGRDPTTHHVLPPRVATQSFSQVCSSNGWGGLPCTPGFANCVQSASGVYYDATPIYAIAVDSSNGTLYSVQNDGGLYRVFKWVDSF
jgi:hypothetical protein